MAIYPKVNQYVCFSVLHCAAAYCIRLQRAAIHEVAKAVYPKVNMCVAACCTALQRFTLSCSLMQCDAVCCSVLQCDAVCCSVLQCVAV